MNGYALDNVVPKAGYWTEAGGPNSEDSKNHFGFQMTTGSDFPILLYNAGHGNVASEGGCQATNVIGWDGYLQADKQGTKDILIGAVHSYSMYTCDLKILDFQDYVDKIEDWLCEQGETEYCNSSRIVPPDTNATKTLTAYLNSLGPQPRTPTIKFIIRVLKMIKKIIEQAQSDGVVGGLLVNWDFICELKNPTTANRYEHGKYNWEGADTQVRYSYTIDLEAQAFIQLLNLRINGMLWHLSSPSGGTRSRVMRLRNFTHIHSNGVTRDIDHASNKRYLQILPHWHADQKPNSILDKQFRFSQG